ncbi:MAG: folate-binding protein [Actinomycetaceae bacterium]|nr:folate-binding protein [Actinomycetaceae bacterium]MDU0971144.1 folate-binding protein [Actinomycetaceae bacterium]
MTQPPDYLQIIDDAAGEQYALAVGAGACVLPDRDTVTVTGPDRLTWLTTLSSQIVSDIGEDSRELLLLDAAGHISFACGVIDDGQTTWLLTDAGCGQPLAAFLDSMRFMLRVEVADRSADIVHVGMRATGPVADAFAALAARSDAIVGLWQDPWPGVTPGGTTYTCVPEHPGAQWSGAIALVAREQADAVVADALAEAGKRAGFPLETEDGYAVNAPRLVGQGAWEARRIQSWRPRFSREVDARSVPHELDWLRSAVHLEKGCYCGQETVARIVNLGRPPRRLVMCHIDGSRSLIPPPGTPVVIGTREVGRLTSVARDAWDGPIGLALIKRNAPDQAAQLVWTEGDTEYRVDVTLVPIVDPAGKSAVSPDQRPGAGVGRLPGAADHMRLGGTI